jgi:hypothetical protein
VAVQADGERGGEMALRIRYLDARTDETIGTTALIDGLVISTGTGRQDATPYVVEPVRPWRRLTPLDGLAWLVALGSCSTGSYSYGVIEGVP